MKISLTLNDLFKTQTKKTHWIIIWNGGSWLIFVGTFAFIPALLRMFVSLVVEIQRDFGIKSDSKVVVHDTFLSVAVPNTHAHTQTETDNVIPNPTINVAIVICCSSLTTDQLIVSHWASLQTQHYSDINLIKVIFQVRHGHVVSGLILIFITMRSN